MVVVDLWRLSLWPVRGVSCRGYMFNVISARRLLLIELRRLSLPALVPGPDLSQWLQLLSAINEEIDCSDAY